MTKDSRALFTLHVLLLLLLAAPVAHGGPEHEFHVLASNNPPFNYLDEDGRVAGIAVDVLTVIMQRVDATVDLGNIQLINWARAVHEASTEPGHILLSPARTPQREAMFQWVGPLHGFKLGLIGKRNRKFVITGPDDLKKLTIGVIRDSAPSQILQKTYGIERKALTELPGDEQLFRMLDMDRVDLVPRGALSATYWMERLELSPNEYEMVHVLQELDLHIAFSPSTDPNLIRALNLELRKLKDPRPDGTNEYQDIVSRHLRGKALSIR